ncbi:MAG: serine/threonine-protein kinase [Planctomycetota bacterium]
MARQHDTLRSSDPPDEPADERVLERVARCIALLERGESEPTAAVCADAPELIGAVQASLDQLRRAGLLGPHEAPALTSFGPYRIERRLGSGGMGSVWLAEQVEPVRRHLALKVIKAGMDSEEVMARFAAERQALARMNHPHIAQLFGAGVTPHGRPYFAMEYVAGEAITGYADRHQLTTAARIALMVPVCRAVQHAHQKGIIHRDLKPSNVLVTVRDGAPVAKVIDFGLAKALDGAADGVGPLTQYGRQVGTPAYMSPEQAGWGEGDVDTRTDVYALGVLLYELLTGVLPLDASSRRTPGGDSPRHLRDIDPPTPSARVQPLTENTQPIAVARRTTPEALHRQLRGELDWIVLRAMAAERERRYPTVEALSADLERHLNGEAVAAAPPSAWYRVRKALRRNRLAVSAAVFLLAGASVAVSGIAFGLQRARQEAQIAAADFRDALDTIDTLLVRASRERLEGLPRATELEVGFREEALNAYRKLRQRRPEDPDLRLRAARVELELGLGYKALGERERACECIEATHRELRSLAQESPHDAEVALALATAGCHLVNLYGWDDRAPELETAYQDARALLERLMRHAPDNPEYPRLLAHLHEDRGVYAYEAGDAARRRELTERARELREQLHTRWPDDAQGMVELGDSYYMLAISLGQTGDKVLALDYARRAAELARHALAKQPDGRELRQSLAARLNVLAKLERDGDPTQSLATHREASALYGALVADYPHRADVHHQLAQPLYGMAWTLIHRRGDLRAALPEVERLAREGAVSNRRALGTDNHRADYLRLQRMLVQLWVLALKAQGSSVPPELLEECAALPEDRWTENHLQHHQRALREARLAR